MSNINDVSHKHINNIIIRVILNNYINYIF